MWPLGAEDAQFCCDSDDMQTCPGCAGVSFPCKTCLIQVINSLFPILQLQGKEDWTRVGWGPNNERQYGNIWKPVVQCPRAQDTTYLMVPSLMKALHHLLCDDSLTGIPSFHTHNTSVWPGMYFALLFLFLMAEDTIFSKVTFL